MVCRCARRGKDVEHGAGGGAGREYPGVLASEKNNAIALRKCCHSSRAGSLGSRAIISMTHNDESQTPT